MLPRKSDFLLISSGLVQMDFGVLWVTLSLPTDQLRGPDVPKLPGNERFRSWSPITYETPQSIYSEHSFSGHDFGNLSSENHHGLDSRFVHGCRRFIQSEKLMRVFLSSNEVLPDRFCRGIPCNRLQNASLPSPKSPIGNYLQQFQAHVYTGMNVRNVL